MRKINSFSILLLITLIGAFLVFPILAQDSATLLKTVDKDLRAAQRDMFSGKTEKAIASLENIQKMLTTIKADDPNNPKLKTAENKFKKLVKDLERRTGKSLGGGTLTTQGSSSETQLAEKPVSPKKSAGTSKTSTVKKNPSTANSDQIPYAARQPLNNANNALNSLGGNLQKLVDPSYTGNKDQLVGNIEKKLSYAKESLDKAKKLATEKGVTSHPDFDAVDSKIGEAEKSIASSKSGYEKNKEAAAAASKEVDADVADLKAVYDKVQSVFDKATGYVFTYNDLKTVEDVVIQIENFEKNDLATVKSKIQSFASKYGSTKDAIDKKADAMGYAGTYYRASYPYTELVAGIDNVSKTRDVIAEDLVRRTTTELQGISKGGADFQVLDRYQKVRNWLKMAIRYQPQNPKVKELQNSIDKRIEDGMKEFHTKIDARTWPDHASNAPSNAAELAKVSLNWFKDSPDWGKRSSQIRHPLAVTVTGPWSVQKKNLLGEPIMYGLPIKLAVRVDDDGELNVVRVYDLTMRTREGRGVKMEPPFDHITVGNSYFIRPDKVK